jgi:hypothetical protein
VSGKTSRSAPQNPSAPSPTASTGARIPRRLQSRSRSAHDSLDSRKPSETATSSFFPSTRTPIITSRHTLSWASRTLRWIPSTHRYTKSVSFNDRLANAAASSCHCAVSRVTVDADRPAVEPRNCSNAGTKSPEDRPCRYSSGSTSATCGDFLAHAGRIAEENRHRSPVSSSMRLSLTRGCRTGTAPATVATSRGSWWPLRTTSR